MKAKLQPEQIKLPNFQLLLAKYDDLVPKGLADLEELRLNTIPKAIADRETAAGEGAYVEKDELQSLVEWKLKHGTFRPNLLKLATSNSTDDIVSTTIKAFSECPRNKSHDAVVSPDLSKPISTLTKLRGIGPSTASLVLSCYSPQTIPFFSDELFRYMHWGETAGGSHGAGWSRKIRYTPTEYKSLAEKVSQWRKRMEKENDESVGAIDLEKVAYVLGKGTGEGEDLVDDDDDDDKSNGDREEVEKEEKDAGKGLQLGEDEFQAKSGTKKRKAQDTSIKSRKRSGLRA